jgi:hypothetical protein
MLDRIVLNQKKGLAVFIYSDRVPFTVSTDDGDILDLIIFFTSPHKSIYDVIDRLRSEDEITQELSQDETEGVA